MRIVKVFFVNAKILFVFPPLSPLSLFLLFFILLSFFHIFDFLIPILLFTLLSLKHLEFLTIANAGSILGAGVSSQGRVLTHSRAFHQWGGTLRVFRILALLVPPEAQGELVPAAQHGGSSPKSVFLPEGKGGPLHKFTSALPGCRQSLLTSSQGFSGWIFKKL